MDYEETGWEGVEWIDRAVVADKRRVVVERVMYLRIPFLARSETFVSQVISEFELLN